MNLQVGIMKRVIFVGVLLASAQVPTHAECVMSPKSLRLVRVPAVIGQLWASDFSETPRLPVAGVVLELQRLNRNKVLRATTEEAGYFAFAGVCDGRYRLRWSKEGVLSGGVDIEVVRGLPARSIAIRLVDQGDQSHCGFICAVLISSSTPLKRAPACLFEKQE